MDCARVKGLLDDYVAGLVEGDEASALEAHVTACAACAEGLERARRRGMLTDAWSSGGEQLLGRVLGVSRTGEAVARDAPKPSSKSPAPVADPKPGPGRYRRLRLAAIVLVGVACIVTAVFLRPRPAGGPSRLLVAFSGDCVPVGAEVAVHGVVAAGDDPVQLELLGEEGGRLSSIEARPDGQGAFTGLLPVPAGAEGTLAVRVRRGALQVSWPVQVRPARDLLVDAGASDAAGTVRVRALLLNAPAGTPLVATVRGKDFERTAVGTSPLAGFAWTVPPGTPLTVAVEGGGERCEVPVGGGVSPRRSAVGSGLHVRADAQAYRPGARASVRLVGPLAARSAFLDIAAAGCVWKGFPVTLRAGLGRREAAIPPGLPRWAGLTGIQADLSGNVSVCAVPVRILRDPGLRVFPGARPEAGNVRVTIRVLDASGNACPGAATVVALRAGDGVLPDAWDAARSASRRRWMPRYRVRAAGGEEDGELPAPVVSSSPAPSPRPGRLWGDRLGGWAPALRVDAAGAAAWLWPSPPAGEWVLWVEACTAAGETGTGRLTVHIGSAVDGDGWMSMEGNVKSEVGSGK